MTTHCKNCGQEFESQPGQTCCGTCETQLSSSQTPSLPKKKNSFKDLISGLKWYEQIWAGLPLLLIFLGGAIGGACGGIAYTYNAKVFKSNLGKPLQFLVTFIITISSFVTYIIAIVIISRIFPDLFHPSHQNK